MLLSLSAVLTAFLLIYGRSWRLVHIRLLELGVVETVWTQWAWSVMSPTQERVKLKGLASISPSLLWFRFLAREMMGTLSRKT